MVAIHPPSPDTPPLGGALRVPTAPCQPEGMAELTIKLRGTCKVGSFEAASRLDTEGGGTGSYGGLPIEVEGLGLYSELKERHALSKSPRMPAPAIRQLRKLFSSLPPTPTQSSGPDPLPSLTPTSSLRSIASVRTPTASFRNRSASLHGGAAGDANGSGGAVSGSVATSFVPQTSPQASVTARSDKGSPQPPELTATTTIRTTMTTTTTTKPSVVTAGTSEGQALDKSKATARPAGPPPSPRVPTSLRRDALASPCTPLRHAHSSPLPTPSTPRSIPASPETGKPVVRMTVSQPKALATHTTVQQTYVVASLADAEALSPDGFFQGMPIEVRGLGLYMNIKGQVTTPPSRTKNPPTTVQCTTPSLPTDPVAQPSPSVASASVWPGQSPPATGDGIILTGPPEQRLLFHKSAFKAHYDAATAPEYPHQLLEAVHTVIFRYAAQRGIERAKADVFFRELQETAFTHLEELLSDIQSVAGRIWTSPRRLEEMEFCFILNDILRCDTPELMGAAATITRAINLLLVNARFCGGIAGVVYRGGGLPDEHRGFFTPNKTYRVPMFLATTIDQQTSREKFCRRAELKFRLPPVLWIIELGREVGCMHVNYLHMSECAGEQEYLFSPYSAFTVEEVVWREKPTWQDPHVVRLTAISDNRLAPEALPLAPWA